MAYAVPNRATIMEKIYLQTAMVKVHMFNIYKLSRALKSNPTNSTQKKKFEKSPLYKRNLSN